MKTIALALSVAALSTAACTSEPYEDADAVEEAWQALGSPGQQPWVYWHRGAALDCNGGAGFSIGVGLCSVGGNAHCGVAPTCSAGAALGPLRIGIARPAALPADTTAHMLGHAAIMQRHEAAGERLADGRLDADEAHADPIWAPGGAVERAAALLR
jgi:hypothetical protein